MTMPFTSPGKDPGDLTAAGRRIRKMRRWLLGALGLWLAWHALAGVAWVGVWGLLAGLGPLAILSILVFNVLMLPLMSARWWLLLRTLGSPVGLLAVCAYRTAANAVSYLTPGPHFGGEPLSVYLLHHRQGIPLTAAGTSVALDRLLEFLASIVVLTFCLINLSIVENGPFTGIQGPTIVIAVLAVFACILAALFTGRRPFSRSFFGYKRFDGLIDFIARGETMAETLFRENRFRFLLANLLSMVHWTAVFAEFWLMSFFLGLPLSFWQLTAVVAVARLAFFTPLPAGIGVLESALPWVTAALGLGSALGLGLCLMVRFRDLLFSLAGLGLAMQYLTCRRKASIINEK
jgi:uncharacterized protein (TIRG00374 family)